MNDTFMKTKPVFPLLVSMALPNVISMLVNSLYNIVDSLFVAQINEQAMTALSLVFPIQNFVNAVAIGFGIGINALVALYRGAGDHDRADTAATHGMALSVLHGILCTLAATAIMPGFLARFTADGTIVSMGVTYSTIVFLFATVNMASLAFEKLFQAVGRMKLTMTALISGCVCNILLDPVLIFGLGPVPAMGIAGAALATGIGQAATLVIYLVVYSTTESPVHLRRKALQPDLSLEGRLYAIGVPAILNLALPSLLVTFLNGLLAAFSESYVVVLGIYYKLQTFLYLPANGIVQGMRPLIGYNYGAKEHARVAKLYQLTLGMSAVIMAAGAALATGIGQAATLVIYLVVYSTTESPVHLRRKALQPDLSLEGRLYAIGVPAILNLALPSLLVTFLNGLLAAFSESYVVVLGIYYKLQTFLYLPANGIVQGMRPLIGYNYGAKEHARVAKLYQLTLGMSAVIMAAGTVICMAVSAPLIGLFSSNPETLAIGQTALRIICLGFVVSAVSTTSSGALEGLGKGAASLVISLCRYVIFIMPLAWLLCRQFGPTGVWHAFWVTEVLSAVIAFAVYRKSVIKK